MIETLLVPGTTDGERKTVWGKKRGDIYIVPGTKDGEKKNIYIYSAWYREKKKSIVRGTTDVEK